MDKFVIKYTCASDAIPKLWKEGPLPAASPKRPVGRPKKRKADKCESPTPKRLKEISDEASEEASLTKGTLDNPLDNSPTIKGHYKSYNAEQKLKVVAYGRLHSASRAAKHYKIPRTTINEWMKTDFTSGVRDKKGKLHKSGRPVIYGDQLDAKIAEWILVQRDMQLPVSVDAVCKYAKQVVGKERPDLEFSASRTWAVSFFRRHDLTLRCRTSLSQRLPQDLESKLDEFGSYVRKQRDANDFDDSMVINMDETPVFFDLVPNKTVSTKGDKSVIIRTTGAEKRHITLVLAVSSAGDVLPPMVIFKGKRELKLKVRKGWVVCVQEKAWMDEQLMIRWINDIYIPYTKRQRSMIVLDSFRGHLTDDVKKKFRNGNAVMAVIPGGCTSKVQPLDVSLNKPVKAQLKHSWSEFISSAVHSAVDDPEHKVKTASKETILTWIENAVDYLCDKKDMIMNSFKVCGISNHRNGCEDHIIRKDDRLVMPELDDESDSDGENGFDGFEMEDLMQAERRLFRIDV